MLKIIHPTNENKDELLKDLKPGQPFYSASKPSKLLIRIHGVGLPIEKDLLPVMVLDDCEIVNLPKETPVIPREVDITVRQRARRTT